MVRLCLLSPSPSSQGWKGAAGWACSSSTIVLRKGLGAHGNRGWKEKRKQLSPRNGFADDCFALLAPQRSWLKLCTAPCPQHLLTFVATAEYGGPAPYPRLLCPFFLPSCLGGCAHTTSVVKVQVNNATISCPSLPACPGWHPAPPAAAASHCWVPAESSLGRFHCPGAFHSHTGAAPACPP